MYAAKVRLVLPNTLGCTSQKNHYFFSTLSVRIPFSVEPTFDDEPPLKRGFRRINSKGLILAQNERWRRG